MATLLEEADNLFEDMDRHFDFDHVKPLDANNTMERKTTKFKCEICRKKFNKEGLLKNHIEEAHVGVMDEVPTDSSKKNNFNNFNCC